MRPNRRHSSWGRVLVMYFSAIGLMGCWSEAALAADGRSPMAQQMSLTHPPLLVNAPIRPEVTCPRQLPDLTPLLLRDLPSYANRVIQRSRRRDRTEDISGYILLASQPDLEPLPLPLADVTVTLADVTVTDSTAQLFFTTLERQYGLSGVATVQVHHWAFMTQTNQGWQLVSMLSSTAGYPARSPASPPRDSSFGVVAQAIQTWLRDCQWGDVYLREDAPNS